MGTENVFVLHTVYIGFYITFVYDILRIFRRVIPHKDLWISMEDLLFWAYCFVTVFLLLYREGNGTLRWFAVVGAFIGMLFYKKFFSKILVNFLSGILIRIVRFIEKITTPIVKGTTDFTKRSSGRLLRAAKRRLTTFKKLLRMNLKARERKAHGKKKGSIPKKATE